MPVQKAGFWNKFNPGRCRPRGNTAYNVMVHLVRSFISLLSSICIFNFRVIMVKMVVLIRMMTMTVVVFQLFSIIILLWIRENLLTILHTEKLLLVPQIIAKNCALQMLSELILTTNFKNVDDCFRCACWTHEAATGLCQMKVS